jgi:signal recognition particle GTPase
MDRIKGISHHIHEQEESMSTPYEVAELSTVEMPDKNKDTIKTGAPESDKEHPERFVPVSEAIRYRRRAQTAEQCLAELKGQLQDTNVELEQSRSLIDKLERRQQIDEVLSESDAVDLEVTRLLTEAAVEMMEDPDIREVVEDLRRHKPYLFRKQSVKATVMGAHPRGPGRSEVNQAAEQAAATGNRRDLLRYLRLRRKTR